ncbi:hypothetical protein [Kineococcus auxinigenes]|uniref:hypothetical protein n=1 Tax=unclassified Kineococcus TaxID=2621656 RepID=UPI003D7C5236
MDPVLVGLVGALGGASITGALGYLAAVRPANTARRTADADRDVAIAALEEERQDKAVTRITDAWELARSDDARDQRVGLRVLRAMLKEPNLSRLAYNMLDEMAQEELGLPLAELRSAWQGRGELPAVDIEVVETTLGTWTRRRTMPKKKITVTRRQVEVAKAKVAADRAVGRQVDPLVRMIADAGGTSRPTAASGPRSAWAR